MPESLGGRFARLWAASTLSALGTGLTTVAAPLYVSARTSSALVVSATAGVALLPWLLFALPAGVLVDRADRRRLMVTLDWVRTALMVLLAVAIASGWSSIILLDLVLFLVNTGEAVFEPASQSVLPAVVPRAALERANGWLMGGETLARFMLAGPFGGFLYVAAASVPFFADAGTYAASAILLGLLGGSFRAAPPASSVAVDTRTGVWAEVAEGLRWLFRQRMLRTMTILIAVLNLTLTAATSVLVLLAKERLHVGAVGYGALFTCMAVGTVLGALTGMRIIKRLTATWTIRVGLLIEAGLHLTLALATSVYVAGTALAVFGVHAALWTIVGTSLRQRLTPEHLMGRVSSATLFIASGGNCIGALLGGVIADAFGITVPYWVAFVVAVIVVATTWHVFNRATVEAAYASPAPEEVAL